MGTQEIEYGYCHCGCGTRTKIATRNNTAKGHVKGQPYKYCVGHRPSYSISPEDLPLCACGCGERVNPPDAPSKMPKYLPGHSRRSPEIVTIMATRPVDMSATPPLCACGCGQKVTRAARTSRVNGYTYIKGQWLMYVLGHSLRKRGDSYHILAEGNKILDKDGYVTVYMPSHPFAKKNGYVLEHRLVMEQMIGRYLRPEEVVHHISGQVDDNRPENLQLIESNAAHTRLHNTGKKRTISTWSRHYDCCVVCGGTERRHCGAGLCELCYQRRRRPAIV